MKIIYEGHEESNDGSIRKVLKSAFIEFSEKTTEYINALSYAENMEAMIFDILDNGFVVVGNGVAIPIFGIREFLAQTSNENNGQRNSSVNQNVQPQKPSNNPPRVNFHKKNKKMHRRIENQSQKPQHNQTAPIAPIMMTPIIPETILPKPDAAQ